MRRTSRLGFCSTSFLREKKRKKIDVSSARLHLDRREKGTRTRTLYSHREGEPSVEVLERREVRLATDFQQDVGFRHSLSVLRSEEEGEEVLLGKERSHGVLYAM